MKLSELTAFRLFDQHNLPHPRWEFLNDEIELTSKSTREKIFKSLGLQSEHDRLVVKLDCPVGGKLKSGLMAICPFNELELKMVEIFHQGKKLGLAMEGFGVEEYIEHKDESFLAIKAVREGLQVYFSSKGGVEVENDWDGVGRTLIPTAKVLGMDWPVGELAKLIKPSMILNFMEELLNFFVLEDATYLEINPVTLTKDFRAMPLGVVMEVDEAARFRHSDWPDFDYGGKVKTLRERRVEEVDSQIKGSVKLVEMPRLNQGSGIKNQGGLTAVMGGGAGSVLFLCDAVLENGLTLANYAEFSGNPPNWALTELTKQVCAIPGVKNLVISSGIANFTPAKANIEAIIEGFAQSPQARNLNIVVRRCGPGEIEGIEMMKKFAKESGFNIQVFDRYTGMTEIVKKLKNG